MHDEMIRDRAGCAVVEKGDEAEEPSRSRSCWPLPSLPSSMPSSLSMPNAHPPRTLAPLHPAAAALWCPHAGGRIFLLCENEPTMQQAGGPLDDSSRVPGRRTGTRQRALEPCPALPCPGFQAALHFCRSVSRSVGWHRAGPLCCRQVLIHTLYSFGDGPPRRGHDTKAPAAAPPA